MLYAWAYQTFSINYELIYVLTYSVLSMTFWENFSSRSVDMGVPKFCTCDFAAILASTPDLVNPASFGLCYSTSLAKV